MVLKHSIYLQNQIISIKFIITSAKSNELLSNKDRVIIEPTFAQPVVSPTSDILNRKFSKLHPEDLQFDDDLAVYVNISTVTSETLF